MGDDDASELAKLSVCRSQSLRTTTSREAQKWKRLSGNAPPTVFNISRVTSREWRFTWRTRMEVASPPMTSAARWRHDSKAASRQSPQHMPTRWTRLFVVPRRNLPEFWKANSVASAHDSRLVDEPPCAALERPLPHDENIGVSRSVGVHQVGGRRREGNGPPVRRKYGISGWTVGFMTTGAHAQPSRRPVVQVA